MSKVPRLLLVVLLLTQLVWSQDDGEALVKRAEAAESSGQSQAAIDLWQQAAETLLKADNKAGAGLAYFFRGRLLSQLDRLAEAEESLKTASGIFSALQRFDGVALAELQLGNNQLEAGQYQAATLNFETAWNAAITAKDVERALVCGDRLASCLEGMSQFGRAKDVRNTALIMAREAGKKQAEGDTLISLASIAQIEKKPKRAERYFLQALEVFKTAGLNEGWLETKVRIARFRMVEKRYAEAALLYDELTKIHNSAETRAASHANGGYCYEQLAEYEKAIGHYKAALEDTDSSEQHAIKTQIAKVLLKQNKREEALAQLQTIYPTNTWQGLRSRAEIYKDIGERELAEKDWLKLLTLAPVESQANLQNQWAVLLITWDRVQEAQALLQELYDDPNTDPNTKAHVTCNLGETHLIAGNYEKAEPLFLSASQSKNKDLRYLAFNNLAAVYQNQGKFQKAIDLYLRNINEVEPGPNRVKRLSTVKNSLGLAYVKLGRIDEGLRVYREALQLRALDDNLRGELVTRNNIAAALGLKGRRVDSISEYEKCLELAKTLRDLRLQGTLHNNLGRAKMYQKADEALAHYEQAIKLSEQVQAPLQRAIALANKGELLLEQGSYDPGLRSLELAKAVLVDLNARDNLIMTQKLLGLEFRRRKLNEQALAELESSIDLIDDGVRGFVNSSASSYLRKHREVHKLALTIYLESDNLPRAFEILELSKASAILAMTRGEDLYTNLPPDLAAALTSLETRIATLLNQQRTGLENRTLKNLKRDYGRALERAEIVKAGSSRITQKTSASFTSVQKQLGPNETLIEFFFIKNSLFAFVVRPDEATIEVLSKDKNLRSLLGETRASLADKNDDNYSEYVAKVSGQILPSLARHIEPDGHLIFITEGPFHTFPLGVLEDESGKALIETHTVEYASSSAVWLTSRERARKTSRARQGLVAALGSHTPPLSGLMNATGLRAGALSPLPATLREIESVSRYLKAPVSLKEEAMTSAKIQQAVPDKSLLHFATHGLVDEEFPLLSGLVTADGILTASEILKWNLDADLVVLSACNTANQSQEGLGLVGLTAAFQHAGTRSLVATLWPVSDDATALWMDFLYTELAQKQTLPEACAVAARKLKKLKPHPHYWAPFINIGKM